MCWFGRTAVKQISLDVSFIKTSINQTKNVVFCSGAAQWGTSNNGTFQSLLSTIAQMTTACNEQIEIIKTLKKMRD
jgi:hypothetical protein